jgi:hypothetical protein
MTATKVEATAKRKVLLYLSNGFKDTEFPLGESANYHDDHQHR